MTRVGIECVVGQYSTKILLNYCLATGTFNLRRLLQVRTSEKKGKFLLDVTMDDVSNFVVI
jgi:hypothetical protein